MKYRMPAEWEEHDACWMAWPCRESLWPDLSKAQTAYALVAKAISEFEKVIMVCAPKDEEQCRSLVGEYCDVLSWPIDDSWTRDSGPICVFDENHKPTLVDWEFNGWGAKFKPFDEDAQFVHRAAKHLKFPVITSSLKAEGGAIHVDGQGTALTTRQCLLNENRNPDWTQQQVDAELFRMLGVEKVIWLNEGLKDDHTDGHIDEIACFTAPGEVLVLYTDDEQDDNYKVLNENLKVLENAVDAQGRSFKIRKLRQPPARYLEDGTRMSLSYINFYLPNGGVVMAEFNEPEYDSAAREVIQEAFPDRKIVQVPAYEIFEGGGGIHCITQQQPKPQI